MHIVWVETAAYLLDVNTLMYAFEPMKSQP